MRRYCDGRCARLAWLTARARQRTSSIKALDVAVFRLRKSRMPSVLAAASVLVDLRQGLITRQEEERAARIAAFRSKLPLAA